jgi:hypothetical protein
MSVEGEKQRGDGANRGVSRVAGDEAELTEATDMMRARRRPQNRHETTANDGGASWVHVQSEGEGKDARLGAQLSGGGRVRVGGLQQRLGRVGAWPGNVRSWPRPRKRARAVRVTPGF